MKKYIILCLSFVFCISITAQEHPSKIIVKFERDFLEKQLKVNAHIQPQYTNGGILRLNVKSLDDLNEQFQVTGLKKVFKHNPKFAERHKKYGLDLFYELDFSTPPNIEEACKYYSANEYVEFAEPVFLASSYQTEMPDEISFMQQWGLYNRNYSGIDINVLGAWEVTKGDPRVVVAIIDNCFDYNHSDLKNNLWNNQNEIPANGIDDDDNGYTDDHIGWNFRDNNPDVLYKQIAESHGTHVGGIVAARSNNGIGVAGVAGGWADQAGTSLMVFRAGYTAEDNQEYISHGYESMVYAADEGAAIAQCSWGGTTASLMNQLTIDYFTENGGGDAMSGGLVIAAAGNSNSSAKHYPAAYDGVLSVGSIQENGQRSSFSNYGNWVLIAAPGTSILSTIPGDSYGDKSGTSMACPMVSGVAALVLAATMDIPKEEKTPAWLADILISTSTARASDGFEIGGLINAKAAIDYACSNTSTQAPNQDFELALYPNPASINLTITTTLENGFICEIYDIFGRLWIQEKSSNQNVSIDISSLTDGAYIARVKNGNQQIAKSFMKK